MSGPLSREICIDQWDSIEASFPWFRTMLQNPWKQMTSFFTLFACLFSFFCIFVLNGAALYLACSLRSLQYSGTLQNTVDLLMWRRRDWRSSPTYRLPFTGWMINRHCFQDSEKSLGIAHCFNLFWDSGNSQCRVVGDLEVWIGRCWPCGPVWILPNHSAGD